MPFALEGASNTFMQLNVRDNVLQAYPLVQLDFPAVTPAAFGLLQCDSLGKMTWLTQYVNALVPPPNLVYFFTGQCDATGAAVLAGDSSIQLKPFGSKVVYAMTLKVRSYNASEVSAVYCQTSIIFDPSLALASLWTPGNMEKFGDNTDNLDVQMAAQRTVSNGVTLSFTATSVAGHTVDVDVIVYDPTGVPVS